MVNQGAGKDVDSDQAKPLGVCEATEQVAQGGDLGGGERSALTSRQCLVGWHHLVLLDVPLHQLHGHDLGHLHAAAQDGEPVDAVLVHINQVGVGLCHCREEVGEQHQLLPDEQIVDYFR